tara:strand:+ start:393 stop:701 length:309 start_codon:yes stop_codon:yes gene_type:complete
VGCAGLAIAARLSGCSFEGSILFYKIVDDLQNKKMRQPFLVSRNGIASGLIKRMLLRKNCAQVAYESGIGRFCRLGVLYALRGKLPILKVACNLPTIENMDC